MTMTTVSDVPALLRCKGECKLPRPLFDFYAAGTNNTNPRSVCKACWKAVNARAYLKRQEQGHRRRALLCLSNNFKRP